MARDWKSIFPLGPGTLSTSRLDKPHLRYNLSKTESVVAVIARTDPTSKRVSSFCLTSTESTFSKNKEEGSRIKGSVKNGAKIGEFGTVFAGRDCIADATALKRAGDDATPLFTFMDVQRRSRGSATLPRHACRHADTPVLANTPSQLRIKPVVYT